MRHAITTLSFVAFLDAGIVTAQSADRWIVIGPDDPVIELDTTTIAREAWGTMVAALPRVWLRLRYNAPRGAADKQYTSAMWQVYFDCQKRKLYDVRTIRYAANGDVVEDSFRELRMPTWSEPVPETVGERALSGFCKTPYGR